MFCNWKCLARVGHAQFFIFLVLLWFFSCETESASMFCIKIYIELWKFKMCSNAKILPRARKTIQNFNKHSKWTNLHIRKIGQSWKFAYSERVNTWKFRDAEIWTTAMTKKKVGEKLHFPPKFIWTRNLKTVISQNLNLDASSWCSKTSSQYLTLCRTTENAHKNGPELEIVQLAAFLDASWSLIVLYPYIGSFWMR